MSVEMIYPRQQEYALSTEEFAVVDEVVESEFTPEDEAQFFAYCDFVNWLQDENGAPYKALYLEGHLSETTVVTKYIKYVAQAARIAVGIPDADKTPQIPTQAIRAEMNKPDAAAAVALAATNPEKAKDRQQISKGQKGVAIALLGLSAVMAPHVVDTFATGGTKSPAMAELPIKATALNTLSTTITKINQEAHQRIQAGDTKAVATAQAAIQTNTTNTLKQLEAQQPKQANVAATSAGHEYVQKFNQLVDTLNKKVETNPNASPAQVLQTQTATALAKVAIQYPSQIPASVVVEHKSPELKQIQKNLEADLFKDNPHYTDEQGSALANLLVQAFQPDDAESQAKIVDPNGTETLPKIPEPTVAPTTAPTTAPSTAESTSPTTAPSETTTQAPTNAPSNGKSQATDKPSNKHETTTHPKTEKKETTPAAPILKTASVEEFAKALEPLIAEGGNRWTGTALQLATLLDTTARRYNIPLLTREVLASQIYEESKFDPNIVSQDGYYSVGLSQFIPGTWGAWGKDLNGDGIANQRDPAEAVDAEARFLISLLLAAHQKFPTASDGDKIKLALYAYNAGPDHIRTTTSLPLTSTNAISAQYIIDVPNHIQQLDGAEGIIGPYTVLPSVPTAPVAPAPAPVATTAPETTPTPTPTETPTQTPTQAPPVATNNTSNQETSNDAIPNQVVDCPEGATDLGVTIGYKDGGPIKIRLCALPDVYAASADQTATPGNPFYIEGANGHAVVNADAAADYMRMAEAAKADGVYLGATNSYRSKDNQQSLCPCDGIHKAHPGFSSHGLGHAIDFVGSNYAWLSQNAGRFGFYANVPGEAWHYSRTGH